VYTKLLLQVAKYQLKLNATRFAVYTEHRILELKDAIKFLVPILSTHSLLAHICSICHLVLPQLCGRGNVKTVDSVSVIGKVHGGGK